ncbi:MAG: TrkH family potassium uptake protein [Blautia sp.]
MNYSVISYIIGWILNFEALFMTLPCLTAVIYREHCGWSFFLTAMFCLLLGIPLVQKKPKNKIFYTKEGFVTVALSWIILSIMGALPFLFGGAIASPIDALFETVSGFTTTGASILSEVESLPKCMLMWRSFTHWIGGMGVLVFLLCLLPLTGGGGYHMNLMKAESPGPSVTKLVPQVQSTAKILYSIYLLLTVVEIILLLLGGMPVFDALTTAFGTAGTGGFGIKNDSITSYSPYIQYVVTVFMILFGVNFSTYFLIYIRKFSQLLHLEEVRWYFIIIFASTGIIAFNVRDLYPSLEETVRHSAFQVASIITTTGFGTTDFDIWPELSRTILVILMFIGACAGSTGGGMKISRFIILLKTVKKELHTYLHPRSVQKIQIDGKVIEHSVVRSTNVYLITYVMIFVFSILIISLDNHDLITNFTAVAATLNNIGPGLNLVGPTQNFSIFSGGAKLILIFDMLAGRLELFPLLLLFVRDTWRKF